MKKRFLTLLTMIFILGMLSGCGSGSKSGAEDSGPKLWDATASSENAYVEANQALLDMSVDMPVLAIQTKTVNENSMRFITEPVALHVAQQTASWTPGYVMPPEPYYEECRVSLINQEKEVLIDNVDASVKVRGNWTTDYDKKPLRLNFAEKVNLLGLHEGKEYKNWLLLAEYKDGSMLRDKSALSMARAILGEDGLYAADAEFVQVVVNGQYWGVYLLTEMQQINQGRVDITEAEKDYQGTDIGYFMEMDGYYYTEDALHQFIVDYADNAGLIPFDGNDGSGRKMKCLPVNEWDDKSMIGVSIKSDIYSKAQHDFIASYVNNVYRIMYEAAYNGEAYTFNEDYSAIEKTDKMTPREAVEKVVDVASLVDMYIISELTCDADIYWSSFYMSVDFGPAGNKKLTFQAPWDFDSGMGNKNRCEDGTGYYAANVVPDVNGYTAYGGVYHTINPWLAVLVYEDYFQTLVHEKWAKAYDSKVFENAIKMIEDDAEKYSQAFTKNYQRWNNLIDNSKFVGELSNGAAKCVTHKKAAEYLKEWLTSRVEFLNQEWH